MDLNSLNTFRTLGEINTAIEKSTSLDGALKAGLKIIRDNLDAQMAVIWYYDKDGDKRLHPSYWVAPNDLTDKAHAVGEGAVVGDAAPVGGLAQGDAPLGHANQARIEALDVHPAAGQGVADTLGGALALDLRAVGRAPGDHAGAAGANPEGKLVKDVGKRVCADEVLATNAGHEVDGARDAMRVGGLDQALELAELGSVGAQLDGADLDDLVDEAALLAQLLGHVRELEVDDDVAGVRAVHVPLLLLAGVDVTVDG